MNIFKKTFVPYVCAALALLLIATAAVGCQQQPSSGRPTTRPNYDNPYNPPNDSTDNPWNDDILNNDTVGTSGDSNDTSDSPSQPDIEYAAWDGSIASGFAGGDGSESAPYEIADGAQLAYLARQVANENETYAGAGVHYILTDNIDLNNHEWCPIGTGVNLSGDYSDNAIFRGSFDGNDKHITNVLIQNAKSYHRYFGLFGNIEGATIQNLTIDNLNYSGIGEIDEVGGLVGRATKSVIENCAIQSGSISANEEYYAGGFAGCLHECTVTNCHVTTNLQCRKGGGFASFITEGSIISDCSAHSNMTLYPVAPPSYGGSVSLELNNYSGGFVGCCTENSVIMYSTSTGTIQNGNSYTGSFWVGGFAGVVAYDSAISDCYSSSDVDISGADSCAAGFVAAIGSVRNMVTRCISFGDAKGNIASGFCDLAAGRNSCITSCIVYGNVYGAEAAYPFVARDSYIGLPAVYCDIVDCYRPENQIVSPQSGNTYGTACYLDDMIRPEFFEFNPFFALIWDFSDFNPAEKKYPQWKDKDKLKNSPIAISDTKELLQLQGFYGSAYLSQSLKFTFNDEGNRAIDFFGVLDGQDNEISNLQVGYVFNTNFGTIKNIRITNTEALGFINKNSGNVENCILDEVSIKVTDISFIANNMETGYITDCSASIKFEKSKQTKMGGIVGNNYGKITNCQTNTYGTVDDAYTVKSSDVSFGGIALINTGVIDECQSHCNITIDVRGKKTSSYVYVGGIATINGVNGNKTDGSDSYEGTIINCYSDCKISISNEGDGRSETYVGGIAGVSNYGLISHCFANVDIPELYTSEDSEKPTPSQYVGGIVGKDYVTVSNCITKITAIVNKLYFNPGDAEYFSGYIVGLTPYAIENNCYYHEDSQFTINKVANEFCSLGDSVSADTFNDESFYFDTLQFSKDIWEMSDELGHIVLKQNN